MSGPPTPPRDKGVMPGLLQKDPTDGAMKYNPADPKVANGWVAGVAQERSEEGQEAASVYEKAAKQLTAAYMKFCAVSHTLGQANSDLIVLLRGQRMALNSETETIVRSVMDLKLLLDHFQRDELDRLKELAEVAERLQRLKDSGFLDAVAETILKLEGV